MKARIFITAVNVKNSVILNKTMPEQIKEDPHKKIDCNDEYAKNTLVELTGTLSTFIDLAAALEYLNKHVVDLMDSVECKDVNIAMQVVREDLKKLIDEQKIKSRLN